MFFQSIKGFFYKIGYLATHFEAAGYAAEVEANPAVYGKQQSLFASSVRLIYILWGGVVFPV